MSGLEGLAGTPQRDSSPPTSANSFPHSNNLDELMGFSNGLSSQSNGNQGVLSGLADLDLSGTIHPPPPKQQLAGQPSGKKTNEDLLALF